jgi:hypothetical protein
MASKDTALEIKELITKMSSEVDVYTSDKSTKASGKRLRKLTLDFEKKGKLFRQQSVAEAK